MSKNKEWANNLAANTHANIIDLLCEGEIGGPAINDDWEQSTYLNEIPIKNDDGTYNYNGVTIEGRTGAPNQPYLSNFNTLENTISVATQVTVQNGPISRTITDPTIDDVKVTISIPALLDSNSKYGNIYQTSIDLNIIVIPDNGNGTPVTVIEAGTTGHIYGKTTSEYRKQFVISNLKQYGPAPWIIKVERITPDAANAKIVNAFSWYSYTEVVQTKLQYSDRAVVGITLDSQKFGTSIPSRAYRVNGRIIKIPDNYDPDTRTYTGDWSGTFKTGVTNNIAWIIYDLLTNKEVGLGNIITEDMVDKWTLYSCGQYCDELVTAKVKTKQPDGSYIVTDITEPRFSFNGVIQKREQGLTVISLLCAAMRAYITWQEGMISFVQDKPLTAVPRPVGISNVSEEGFTYQGVPKRDRHSVVDVSWNDPDKLGRLSVEEVIDDQAILDFGYNERQFNAFGCTSRSEAIRRANYILYTDLNTSELVNFKGGLEWADAIPGTLIAVQDPNYANITLEGRVKSGTLTSLVLDKDIVIESGVTYTMLIQISDGEAEERTLTNAVGTTNTLTWSTDLPEVPFTGAQIVISSSNVATRKFVLISATLDDNFYNIKAVEYDETKYAAIDNGIISSTPVSTVLKPAPITPPTNITAKTYTYASGNSNITMFGVQINWVLSTDARVYAYEVYVRETGTGDYFLLTTTSVNGCDIKPVPDGTYDIKVIAIAPTGKSVGLYLLAFDVDAYLNQPLPVTDLDTADGGGIWNGPDCKICWTASSGSLYNGSNIGTSNLDYYLIEVKTPSDTIITEYTVPATETEFTYTYQDNQLYSTNPLRELLFKVATVDVNNNLSTYVSLSASNPIPDMSSVKPTITPKFGYLHVSWPDVSDNDMDKYEIYLDSNTTPTTLQGTVKSPITSFDVQGLDYGTDYYCIIKPYDLFGPGNSSLTSDVSSITKIPSINLDVELTNSITKTDSDGNSIENLYDGTFNSGGTTYTVSGTDKYIQYEFGLEDYFDRVGIWTADDNARVYIGYSSDGSTWSYLKATNHELDSDDKLIPASTQNDARTNYWQLTTGNNPGLFPDNITAKYLRLYLTGSYTTTIYELVFSRILISELAAIKHLSSYSANIGLITAGVIQSPNYPTTGLSIDIDQGLINGTINDKLYVDTNVSGNGLIIGDWDGGTGWVMNNDGLFSVIWNTEGHAFSNADNIPWQNVAIGNVEPIDPNFELDLGDVVLGGYNYKWISTGDALGGIFWDQSTGLFDIRGATVNNTVVNTSTIGNNTLTGDLTITDTGSVQVQTGEAGKGLIVGDYTNGDGWWMSNKGLFSYILGNPLHAFAITDNNPWQQTSNITGIDPIDPSFTLNCGDVVLGTYNYKYNYIWTQKTSITNGRYDHSAIYYNNGVNNLMVVFGGTNGSGYFNEVWECNLDTNTWTQKTLTVFRRSDHSAIYYNNGVNNLMVVFGGTNGSNSFNEVWECNLDTDTWTQKTSGATGRSGHSGIYYNNGTNNLMVIFGGMGCNDVWEYNLDTDTWTQKTSGATGRQQHTAIYYNNGTNNLMVIFGGYVTTGRLNDVWEYNLDTNTWTQKTSGATGRCDHSAIYYNNGVNNLMVVFGGFTDSGNTLNDIWEYNLDTDTWTQKTSGAIPRSGHSGIYYNNGTDNIMVIFGGYYQGCLSDVWGYNITQDAVNNNLGGIFWDQSEKTLNIHGAVVSDSDIDYVSNIVSGPPPDADNTATTMLSDNLTKSSGDIVVSSTGSIQIQTSTSGTGLIVGDYTNGTGWLMNNTGLYSYIYGANGHAFSNTDNIPWQNTSVGTVEPIDPNFELDLGDVVLGGYNYKWTSTGEELGGVFWDQSEGKLFLKGATVTGTFNYGNTTVGFTPQTSTGTGNTTIDWTKGVKYHFVFGSQDEVFTFINPSKACNVTLLIKQDSVGGRDCTFPSNVKWFGNKPIMTDGEPNKTIMIAMYYDETTWWAQATPWEAT